MKGRENGRREGKTMEVIMLKGPKNCGKTTTLNLVYDDLVNNHHAKIHTAKKQLGEDPNDFEAVLIYQKKKIAIFTMGDLAYEVIGAMGKYDYLAVDILVIACNDGFIKPFTAIEQYPHDIIDKKKRPPGIRDKDDKNVADKIIARITAT